MPDIRHVVVLMLENRSFDHMLGFLDGRAEPVDGLTGNETNHVDPLNPASPAIPVSRNASYTIDPDPGHELGDVNVQLFGNATAPTPPAAVNSGFVRRQLEKTRDAGLAARVMDCFDPARLPTLTQLAREFMVCDRWFCSVPGPTWPNRLFVHAATSDGEANNTVFSTLIGFRRYSMRTIYDLLSESGRDWKIYFADVPQSGALSRLRARQYRSNFDWMHRFYMHVADGTLAAYSFIEPRYFRLKLWHPSDQHSDHDVRVGEHLIADIYEALRARPTIWNHCLFIITHDEHGGLYDHVAPPYDGEVRNGSTVRVPNPDGKEDRKPEFQFTRLGPRVPAILVSPWVRRGGTDSTTYDHTSVIATVRKLFGLGGPLTERDARAATFDHVLSLTTPRADAPVALDRPGGDAEKFAHLSERNPWSLPDDPAEESGIYAASLNDLQRDLYMLSQDMDPTPPPEDPAVVSDILDEGQAVRRAMTSMQRFLQE